MKRRTQMSKFRDPSWKTDYLKHQLKKELSRKEPSLLALDYYSGKITYAEYLESDHWRNIRKLKLEKTNNACEICGEDEVRLDIHHKNYETLGHESLDDLAALCPYCHSDVHEVIKTLKGKEFKQKVYAIATEYYIANVVKKANARMTRNKKTLDRKAGEAPAVMPVTKRRKTTKRKTVKKVTAAPKKIKQHLFGE